jgi:hypothetical protein
MAHEIKEPDWKLLRELHPIALERFSQRVLDEVAQINSDSAKSCHQRYGEIFGLIKRRDKEMALVFNTLRRSTALIQLAAMQARDLLTQEEFALFSPEACQVVAALLAI